MVLYLNYIIQPTVTNSPPAPKAICYNITMQLVLTSVALGLAGIDPMGMLLLATARAGGLSKRAITLFGITVLVGTISLGVGATLLLGGQVQSIAHWLNNFPNEVYVVLQIIVISALAAWAVKRLISLYHAKPTTKTESKLIKFLRFGAIPIGLLFALSMFTDPSFLALIPLSAHHDNIIITMLVFTVWIVIGQLPMFIFIVAAHLNADKKLVTWLQKFQKRHQKRISIAVTACIALAAIILAADTIWFLTTQRWLI